MSVENKWTWRRAGLLLPVSAFAALLMTACGGTTAPSTTVPATITVAPTAMMTAMQPTAMVTAMEPTAMATAMTTAGVMETPGARMTPGGGMMAPITVQLNELNNSGQSGTAILGESTDGDTVMITLTNGTTEPQPAHIHKGTCANLDPKPLVPLTNVVDGKSETTITGGITTMERGQPYAINVHKSGTDLKTYVACGDIPISMMGSETPGAMMQTPGAMMQTPGTVVETSVPTP